MNRGTSITIRRMKSETLMVSWQAGVRGRGMTGKSGTDWFSPLTQGNPLRIIRRNFPVSAGLPGMFGAVEESQCCFTADSIQGFNFRCGFD